MGNYNTKLTLDDSDYLAKIQKAREELNKTTQAARQANEQTKQEAVNRQALVRATEAQRRETDKLKDTQEKQSKAAKEGSPWKDALREIPMVGRAMDFLEGPLGRLALRYKAVALAAGAIGAVGAGFISSTRRAMGTSDQATITGVSASRSRAFSMAAPGVGADPSQVTQSVSDLRRNQGAALSGQQEQIKFFQQLGISLQDLERSSPDELFLQIARSLSVAGNNAEMFNAATKVMGEGSRNLFPAFQKGFAGIVDEIEKGNSAINDSTIKSMAFVGEFWGKQWNDMKTAALGTMDLIALRLGQLGTGLAGGIASTLGSGIGDEMLVGLFNDKYNVSAAEGEAGAQQKAAARAQRKEQEKEATKVEAQRAFAEDQQVAKAEELLALQEMIKAAEFESLDAVAKQAELKERISRAQSTIALLQAEGGNEAEIARQQLQVIEAQNALKQMAQAEVGSTKGQLGSTNADTLQRVGIFRGAASMTALERIGQQQLAALDRIEQAENNTTSAVREGLD
jgi:hypothetical protein